MRRTHSARPIVPTRRLIRREGMGLFDNPRRSLPEISARLRRSCQLNFLTEAAMRRAVAALGAARRLVGEDPTAFEREVGSVIGDVSQRAGVERAGDPYEDRRSAVDAGSAPSSGDRAVALDAGLELHHTGDVRDGNRTLSSRVKQIFTGRSSMIAALQTTILW